MLDVGGLVLGAELGRGGQGSVWEVLNASWDAAPSGGVVEGLVLKRYRPAALGSVDAAVLESMLRFWEGLGERDRVRLLGWVAWPLETAGSDGVLEGFVMPQVPDAFYFERRLASEASRREMAAVEFLLNDAGYLRRAGIAVDGSQRCAILADLAEGLAFLHERGVVVGDVSPKNALWSTEPACRAFLIDADSMAVPGRSAAAHRVETPDWAAPDGVDAGGAADDVFKLGLMALRVLTGTQTGRDPRALGADLSDIGSLVEASLAADPRDRPSASEWIRPLSGAATAGVTLDWLHKTPHPNHAPAGRISITNTPSRFSDDGPPAQPPPRQPEIDGDSGAPPAGGGPDAGGPQPPRQPEPEGSPPPAPRPARRRALLVLASTLALAAAAAALWTLINSTADTPEPALGQDPATPTELPPLHAMHIGAFNYLACGLRVDGTVECWGWDMTGEWILWPVPAGVYSAISTGIYHACGLRVDGTLECWYWWQEDTGEVYLYTPEDYFPAGVFSAVSAASGHACGLRVDGTLECWGWDGPTDVPAGVFSAVSVAGNDVCGLRVDGTVECWYWDYSGVDDQFWWSDVPVPAGVYSAISTGIYHACGLRVDGTVECWALADLESDYGFGESDLSGNPAGVFSALFDGDYSQCGLRVDGIIECWYWGETGELIQRPVPAGAFSAVSAASDHACGLRNDGTVECWVWEYWNWETEERILLDVPARLDVPAGAFSAVSVAVSW